VTRVGAIDCGTNSVRLLIADVADGRLTDVVREVRIVRLGEGVDRSGRLLPDAIERTRVALHDYAATLERHGVQHVRMVATSATRDAGNRDEFVAMVRRELAVEPEVVAGVAEAALALRGATSALPQQDGPVLVVDLGGGSTELVRGGGPIRAHSMDVGSVRMTERHLHDDPPTAAQVETVEADVRDALVPALREVPLVPGIPVVGVAATVVTVAAVALALPRYEPGALHGATLAAADVDRATDQLIAMTRAERLAHPVIHPGRVDVIVGGAIVLRTVLRGVGADRLTVSEHDILDGIVLDLAERQPGWSGDRPD